MKRLWAQARLQGSAEQCLRRSSLLRDAVAGGTCRISPATSRSRPAISSPTGGRRARSCPGTVARGEDQLQENAALYTGKDGAVHVGQMPVPITRELIARGRERYDIFCAPCHDRTGGGEGMVVKRGYRQPSTFHVDRLRQAPRRLFLRRDDQRVRRDARLPRADLGARSLGDRCLHACAAAQSARRARRRSGAIDRPALDAPATRAGARPVPKAHEP